VDFKVKMMEVEGKKIKMTIWDTGMCVRAIRFRSPPLKSYIFSILTKDIDKSFYVSIRGTRQPARRGSGR
jgi:hypothetical protein